MPNLSKFHFDRFLESLIIFFVQKLLNSANLPGGNTVYSSKQLCAGMPAVHVKASAVAQSLFVHTGAFAWQTLIRVFLVQHLLKTSCNIDQ